MIQTWSFTKANCVVLRGLHPWTSASSRVRPATTLGRNGKSCCPAIRRSRSEDTEMRRPLDAIGTSRRQGSGQAARAVATISDGRARTLPLKQIGAEPERNHSSLSLFPFSPIEGGRHASRWYSLASRRPGDHHRAARRIHERHLTVLLNIPPFRENDAPPHPVAVRCVPFGFHESIRSGRLVRSNPNYLTHTRYTEKIHDMFS